jgi:hypothetical protein
VARFLSTAIVAIFAVSIVRVASAQDGPGANASADTPRPVSAAPAATIAPAPAVPVTEAIRLDEYLNRLDQWRNEGRITAAEAARARRLLNAAVVGGDRSVHVPLDASGRIDLLALARGQTGAASPSTPPGERLTTRILNEFDIRMRVKARDMAAASSLTLFAAAPGYAAVPTRDLGRIVKGALETTPMGELPGGTRLVSAIDTLPNTSGVKAGQNFRKSAGSSAIGRAIGCARGLGRCWRNTRSRRACSRSARSQEFVSPVRAPRASWTVWACGSGYCARPRRTRGCTPPAGSCIATVTCCRNSTSRRAFGARPGPRRFA